MGGISGGPVYLPNHLNICYAILVKEPSHDQTYNIATLITEAIFNIIARDIIDAL